MNDLENLKKPQIHSEIENKSKEIAFTMPSDLYIGNLLRTLVATKPNSKFLEIGTGIGLSLSWMIDGMDNNSNLITIDNDPKLIEIVKFFFDNDKRVEIICTDGSKWIKNYKEGKFDLIFADTWPGKYTEIDETLDLLKIGGLYVIDDMNPQANWPEDHPNKVNTLINYLDSREDLHITKLNWSTGIIIATKTK